MNPTLGRVFVASLAAALVTTPALAQLPYGPDTCRQGYVWREAFPGDHVCVTPQIRAQAADDNRQASARRAPGGGPYGPDTCLQGFVWREARPDDHVCVTPEARTQAASDNQQAAARRASASIDDATKKRCAQYARNAIRQYQIMTEHPKCRVDTGGRWQPNYQDHYNWCLTAADAARRSEEKLRNDHLLACGGLVRFD